MQQDRRDSRSGRKRSRSRSRQNHRQHNRNHSNRNRYDNNRNYNRNYNQHRNNSVKIRPKVRVVNVEAPKSFVLSAAGECRGALKVNIIKNESQPSRCQTSRLGELKNKITPVQKIWSSHIKQYLNISEFVQIHRYNKSLAYAPIQYGKSVINYQEEFNSIHYSNLTEQSQIFSRAYFKLWEILQTGVLDQYKNKQLSIGCVAQGPGGFIHALIDYRIKQQRSELTLQKDFYNAITLKIDSNTRNAKDWSDQRASKLFGQLRRTGQSINLSYGKTGTGDLLKTQNIEYFSNQIKKKCELVTGDGGIQCIGDKQFEYQQVFNAKLFFGEIITALHIQQVGGKFILKIYDCGFALTRQLIVLLALYYDKVQIIKPITSRPGNSQKYLLCEDFRGISQDELNTLKDALVQWTQIEPKLSYFQNKEFVHNIFDFSQVSNYQLIQNRIKQANDWFVQEQIQKIEEGLGLIEKFQDTAAIEQELKSNRFGQQISFAYSWCKKYGLSTIDVQVQQAGQ